MSALSSLLSKITRQQQNGPSSSSLLAPSGPNAALGPAGQAHSPPSSGAINNVDSSLAGVAPDAVALAVPIPSNPSGAESLQKQRTITNLGGATGLKVTLIRSCPSEGLGIVVDPNLVITSIRPDTPAARAGVPLRHRIVAANERLVVDLASFQAVVHESRPSDALTLRVVPMRLRNELNESALSDFLVALLRGEDLDLDALQANPDYEFLNEHSKFYSKYMERRAEVLQAKAALDNLEAKILERERTVGSRGQMEITDEMYETAIQMLDNMLEEKEAAERAVGTEAYLAPPSLPQQHAIHSGGWIGGAIPHPSLPSSFFPSGQHGSTSIPATAATASLPTSSLSSHPAPMMKGASVPTAAGDPISAANLAAILESLPMLGGIAQPYSAVHGSGVGIGMGGNASLPSLHHIGNSSVLSAALHAKNTQESPTDGTSAERLQAFPGHRASPFLAGSVVSHGTTRQRKVESSRSSSSSSSESVCSSSSSE